MNSFLFYRSDVKVKEEFLRKMEHRLAEKEKELESMKFVSFPITTVFFFFGFP